MCTIIPEELSDRDLFEDLDYFSRWRDGYLEAKNQASADIFQRQIDKIEKEIANRGLMREIVFS